MTDLETDLSRLSVVWTGDADRPEDVMDLRPDDLVADLPVDQLERMRQAGGELVDVYRVLAKTGDNIVGLLLAGHETFYEWNHYPDGDCYDPETHSQYYYHAHRGALGEHGHFHTFLRAKGMSGQPTPLPFERAESWPKGSEAVAHLVAISMDRFGVPTHLFTTNRWVTGETLYGAEDVIAMLERFEMDLIHPSWAVNRWMSALVALFRPQIEQLLHKRDAVLAARLGAAEGDPLEDRDLEITSIIAIDADTQIAAVEKALAR